MMSRLSVLLIKISPLSLSARQVRQRRQWPVWKCFVSPHLTTLQTVLHFNISNSNNEFLGQKSPPQIILLVRFVFKKVTSLFPLFFESCASQSLGVSELKGAVRKGAAPRRSELHAGGGGGKAWAACLYIPSERLYDLYISSQIKYSIIKNRPRLDP